MRLCSALLLLLLIAPPALGADTVREPAPLRVLSWGHGALEPGLWAGAEDEIAIGPSALAVDVSGQLLLADRVHQRILRLSADGNPESVLPANGPMDDLRVDGRSRLNTLDISGQIARVLSPDGQVLETLPAVGRALAIAPGGEPWSVARNASAEPLRGTSEFPRATPMGAGANWHGVGLVRTPFSGAILLWPWDRAAIEKPPGPARTIEVTSERRLGLIRPLRVDREGRVHVLVETLSATAPLQIEVEARCYSREGELLGRVVWAVDSVATSGRSVDVAADGTWVRMESRKDGVALWRIEPTRWIERGVRP